MKLKKRYQGFMFSLCPRLSLTQKNHLYVITIYN